MSDADIFQHITALVDEEHQLYTRGEQGSLDAAQRARLHELGVSLDQCWDLLRQRRARREFGHNPREATVRDAATAAVLALAAGVSGAAYLLYHQDVYSLLMALGFGGVILCYAISLYGLSRQTETVVPAPRRTSTSR